MLRIPRELVEAKSKNKNPQKFKAFTWELLDRLPWKHESQKALQLGSAGPQNGAGL